MESIMISHELCFLLHLGLSEFSNRWEQIGGAKKKNRSEEEEIQSIPYLNR